MKKVVIITLVVVAVLAIAVLAVRPGGASESVDPPAYVQLVDSLSPKVRVRAADVAGKNCWDDGGVFSVPSGSSCSSPLPDQANQLRICVAQGSVSSVRIDGQKYAPADADLNGLACPSNNPIRLYDEGSSLIVTCAATGTPCRLQLL